MRELYLDKKISKVQLCHINFGLAKACEDLGELKQAFIHYNEGNSLRKKLLKYNISRDIKLFKLIKSNYPAISKNSIDINNLQTNITPIFIVGMPRSGTTLVEQIVSSHSLVTGAGELPFVDQFGRLLNEGLTEINKDNILEFRENYLRKLKNCSYNKGIVTDKMTSNFLYIGLISTALPEAKIIHVKRNPAAVCWANYTQYFDSKELDYCYDLDDVVYYYKLYRNIMKFWEYSLSNKIYNLDYELLTVNQEKETQRLIQHIGLGWDQKCLKPQENFRNIATASNLQVRKKVYQKSSQKWKKYKPFLNDKLDNLIQE